MCPLYNYECVCGNVTEKLARMGVKSIPCPACGQPATRLSVYQFQVASSGLPTRAGVQSDARRARQKFADFQEASHEIDHAYKEREKDVGHPIKAPSYYKEGVRRATRLRKAGVKSLSEIHKP